MSVSTRILGVFILWGVLASFIYWLMNGNAREVEEVRRCGKRAAGVVDEVRPNDHNAVVVSFVIGESKLTKKFYRVYAPNASAIVLRPGDRVAVWSCPEDSRLALLGDPAVAERSERSGTLLGALGVSAALVWGLQRAWRRVKSLAS
jgi:hypothetical protein